MLSFEDGLEYAAVVLVHLEISYKVARLIEHIYGVNYLFVLALLIFFSKLCYLQLRLLLYWFNFEHTFIGLW